MSDNPEPNSLLLPVPEFLMELVRKKPKIKPVAPPATGTDRQTPPEYIKAAIDKELAILRGAPEGQRNDQLNRSSYAFGRMVGAGWLSEARATEHLRMTAYGIGLEDPEVTRTIRSGLRAGMDQPREPVEGRVGGVILYPRPTEVGGTQEAQPREDQGVTAVDDIPNLPEAFWAAREIFKTIRQAAHNRALSGDAVMGALLARIAAGVPYVVRLRGRVGAPVPLSLIVNLVGDAGAGKSAADRTAQTLLPLDPARVIDHAPIGTGEGLAEMLFETVEEPGSNGKPNKVRRQTRHNAHVYVDEGEALIAIAKRKDSTVLSTIRSIYTGAELGQMNASQERKRPVPYGSHTFGIVIAIQDLVAATLLDHESDGTPQRFLWLSAYDKSVPDEPPETDRDTTILDPFRNLFKVLSQPVRPNGEPFYLKTDPAIEKQLWDDRVARVRGREQDPMQAHRNLTRFKVAGCLAILDQRLDINLGDWKLAGIVMDTSDAVLARMRRLIAKDEERREARSTARSVNRRVAEVQALDEVSERKQRIESCAMAIRDRVEAQPGLPVSDVRRNISNRLRDVLDDGLGLAIQRGWIEERPEKSASNSGEPKRALYPGGEE